MSSFTISKKEYMKAAGFIVGLAEQKNRYRESLIWMWNLSKGHLYTDEEWVEDFTKCFLNNAKSVQLQYKDDTPEEDPNEYREEFKLAKTRAKELYTEFSYGNKEPLTRAVFEFQNFTSSVNYQIEDAKLNFFTMNFLNQVTVQLVKVLSSTIDLESWGSFEL